MKNIKKLNRKGFTLIELLVVISILALVLSITMYSVTSIIRNAKGKTYLTTINEIEKAASNYITENSSELLFVSNDDNATETQCVSVQDLIDYGFLDNNVINSNVTEDKKVNIGDYIYVERNKTTKTIEKNVYIYDEKTSINNICEATAIAVADINFEVNPKDWSREKNVKITYRVKTNSSFHDIKYGYEYTSDSGNDIIPYSSDNVNLKNVTVSEKGTMYADILYEDNKADGTKVINKFDTSGPKISLYSDEKKYISKKVTIPLSIKDCKNSDNCSGLKEYTGDELANIISSEKLSVLIGNTKVNKSYLTLSNKESGIFNLVIDAKDTKYNGNVTITIKKDTFFDKTVDKPNGNIETTLESKIIFDNTIPNVEGDSTKTYFVSKQTVTLNCSDDNGISGYYIGNTSPKTSDYTEVNNFKNYVTTKKITSAGTYYLSCKDSAGNIETNEIKYYNYTLKYMLLTEDGTKGTYSLENYNGVSSNKYLLPENASIVITQINNKINSNIPIGSSSNNYVGYNKVNASSSISDTQIFNIVEKDNINQSDFNITDNLIYMFWFNRNLLNIKYQLADGETFAPGSYESDKYTWSVDDSYVKRTIISSNNSTITFNSYRYRSGNTEINLYNNKTSGYFTIQKTGYLPKSGEEWKCTSGCKTNNMTFSQAKHEIDINNNVCDISKNDCDITLRANWIDNIGPIIEFKLLNTSDVVQDSQYYYDENGTNSNWFNFQPKLWFKVTDSGSGVNKNVRFNWNSTNNSILNDNISGGKDLNLEDDNIKDIVINSIGYRYVEFIAKDNSGNSTTKKIYFKYDNVKPTCTITGLSNIAIGDTITATVTCSDNFTNITNKTLTESDFNISNTIEIVQISNIETVTNGYKYKVKIRGKAIGSYTLEIKANLFSDSAGNKNDTYTSSSYSVTKGNATCPTLKAYKGDYNGNSHSITVSGGSGGTIQYRTSTTGTWSDTKPTRTNAGTTTVYVRVYGDSNHNTTDCGNSTITINKVVATCPTLTPFIGNYDGNSHSITVSGGSGGTIQYRTSTTGTWSDTKPTRKDSGKTTVYVRVNGDSNHNTMECGSSTITINKVAATCPTLTAYERNYDGYSHSITVSGGSGGTIQYRTSTTGTWSNTKPTRRNAGTTTVYVRVYGDSNHNTRECGSSTITVLPSGGCFLKGTPIKTIYGYKEIDKIRIGDLVLSYNEVMGVNEYKRVEKVMVHIQNTEFLYSLIINKKELKVTGAHRFYIKRNNELLWLSANKLKVGDMVKYANGKYYKIDKIFFSLQTNTVYNLMVADNHNYYVSNEMILVHNAKEHPCDDCFVK